MELGGLDKEVLEGKNVSNWVREHLNDISAKNVCGFCLCSMNLTEAELESFVERYFKTV